MIDPSTGGSRVPRDATAELSGGKAQPTALVIGGFGGLGTAIAQALEDRGDRVLRTSRTAREGAVQIDFGSAVPEDLSDWPVLDAVVWAHGENINDCADDVDGQAMNRLLDTNVTLIARSVQALLAADRLRDGARLVVLSSIWQEVARPGKLSYTVSKAAVGGLVRALALDLAPRRMLVNAVLPGVVDTAMTRQVLDDDQIRSVEQASPLGRLVHPQDVASLVAHLTSVANTGVTGQSIAVDLGFSVARAL